MKKPFSAANGPISCTPARPYAHVAHHAPLRYSTGVGKQRHISFKSRFPSGIASEPYRSKYIGSSSALFSVIPSCPCEHLLIERRYEKSRSFSLVSGFLEIAWHLEAMNYL